MTDKNLELLSDNKSGESNCCGAGTHGDNLICKSCGEHCDDVSKVAMSSEEMLRFATS